MAGGTPLNVSRTDDELHQQRVERIHDDLRNGLLGRPAEETLGPGATRVRTGADRLHEDLSGRYRELRRFERLSVGHALTRIMHQGPDPGRDTRASVW